MVFVDSIAMLRRSALQSTKLLPSYLEDKNEAILQLCMHSASDVPCAGEATFRRGVNAGESGTG